MTDAFQYTFEVSQYLVVPEAKHAEAQGFRPSGALKVVLPSFECVVLLAIDLGCKSVLEGDTIDDVRADRSLSAKLGPSELMREKLSPQALLSFGRSMP